MMNGKWSPLHLPQMVGRCLLWHLTRYCAWFLFVIYVPVGQVQAVEVTYTWKFEKYAVGQNATGDANDASVGVMMPDIIQLPDGTYRMYYGAVPPETLPSGARTVIKSATSTDGINWTVEEGYRLIGDGDGDDGPDGIPANEGVISGPRVVRLSDGTFRMYYQASTQGTMPPDFRVKSATSADGINWAREGTRIDINYPNGGSNQFSLAGHCYVIRFADDDYVILISANYGKDAFKPSDLVIGTSSDGLTFANFSILYEQGHDPYVLKLADGSGYRLFYGLLLERQRTALSVDGKNWPPASETTETILLNADGNEVTEASTESPGDRAAIEHTEGVLLFVNWGNPLTNIALMKEQHEICTGGQDDDGDGLVDCEDSDCACDLACAPTHETSCTNGVDDDCDGLIDCQDPDCPLDKDGDGYYASPCGQDCDDTDASVYPGAPEICDGKDNDCDNQVDEGVKNTYYRDADGDGYGDPDNTTQACSQPPGYVTNNQDCDDTNANVNPGGAEICNDLADNDCDGLTDCDDADCESDPACARADLVSDPEGLFMEGPISKKNGKLVKATLRVKNRGNEDSGTFSVKTYLSDDATLDEGDTLKKISTVKKLKAGKTKNIKLKIKDTASMVGKYLISSIDPDGHVPEISEDNNRAIERIP
ncbi:MAG: MopE-related protein [Candidatus Brocadia sp.]